MPTKQPLLFSLERPETLRHNILALQRVAKKHREEIVSLMEVYANRDRKTKTFVHKMVLKVYGRCMKLRKVRCTIRKSYRDLEILTGIAAARQTGGPP